MNAEGIDSVRRQAALLFARVSVFLLGATLALGAIAPMVIHRVVSGEPPPNDTLLFNTLIMLIGWLFIALSPLMRRELRWAIWSAFLGAALLGGGGLAMSSAAGLRATDVFLIGMCGIVCFSCFRLILMPEAMSEAVDSADDTSAADESEGPAKGVATGLMPPVRNSKMFLVREQ